VTGNIIEKKDATGLAVLGVPISTAITGNVVVGAAHLPQTGKQPPFDTWDFANAISA
jgi:hypothetical protein